jgi:CheY-like chemotaxis protein
MKASFVLVVEDDPVIGGILATIMENLIGLPVTLIGDGYTAARFLRHERPALILLDMRLPELSGIDLARML